MESNQLLNQMKDLNKNLARIDRHLEDIVKALTVPRTPRCSGRYPWPKIEDSLGFIDFNSDPTLRDKKEELVIMTSTDGIIAMGMTILAMFGVGYLVNKEQRMDKLAKSVGMTVKEIRDANDIEIREAVVNKAVTEAVNRSVNSHMSSMSQDIYQNASRTLKDKIANVVNDEVSRIRTTVQDRVYSQVNRVDISQIKRNIEDSVKEKILEKLDDKLDELVDDITDDYRDKHKVYVIRK